MHKLLLISFQNDFKLVKSHSWEALVKLNSEVIKKQFEVNIDLTKNHPIY